MADELQDTLINRALAAGKNFGIGAGKGLARLPLDLGHMVRETPLIGPVIKTLSGDPDDKLYEPFRKSFSPVGRAQGLGYGAEKLGELAVMAGTPSSSGANLPQILKYGIGGIPRTLEQGMGAASDVDYLARLGKGAVTKLKPAASAILETSADVPAEMVPQGGEAAYNALRKVTQSVPDPADAAYKNILSKGGR